MLLEPLCISIALFLNMNFHPLFSCSILLKAILFMYVMIWIVNKPSFRYSWFSFSRFDKVPLPLPSLVLENFKKFTSFWQFFFESNFSKFFWYPKCKKSKKSLALTQMQCIVHTRNLVFFWIPLKLKGIETSVNSYYNNSKALPL